MEKNKRGFIIFNPGETVPERINLAKRNSKYSSIKSELENLNEDQLNSLVYLTTPIARKLYNFAREVLIEIHRSRMFTRLEISKKGILYTYIEPEHHVCDFTCNFFLDRFPLFTIIVGSQYGTFVGKKENNKKIIKKYDKSMKSMLDKLEKDNHNDNILTDISENSTDDLWETFYEAHNIKERKNIRYFKQNVPLKSIKNYNLKEEGKINIQKNSLYDFF